MVAGGHARRVPSAPRVGFHVYTVDRGGRLCNRSFPVPAAAGQQAACYVGERP